MAIDLVADSGYVDYTEGATCGNLINGFTLYSSNNGISATSEDVRGNKPKNTYVRAPGWVQVSLRNLGVMTGEFCVCKLNAWQTTGWSIWSRTAFC